MTDRAFCLSPWSRIITELLPLISPTRGFRSGRRATLAARVRTPAGRTRQSQRGGRWKETFRPLRKNPYPVPLLFLFSVENAVSFCTAPASNVYCGKPLLKAHLPGQAEVPFLTCITTPPLTSPLRCLGCRSWLVMEFNKTARLPEKRQMDVARMGEQFPRVESWAIQLLCKVTIILIRTEIHATLLIPPMAVGFSS